MNPVIDEITKDAIRSDLTEFKVGDGVRVHIKIQEAGKERIQVFSGIVIARKGSGVHETFTVRRISFGEGVEKVFPVNSPNFCSPGTLCQLYITNDELVYIQLADLVYITEDVGSVPAQ